MIVDYKSGSNCDRRFHQTTGPAPPRRWLAGAPALLLVGLVIAATMAIAARTAIVSIAPATAAAYALAGMPVNLRGLSIVDVRATATHEANSPGELLVTGEIANLRLALRGEDGRELYVWTARGPKTRLAAHEHVTFRARLAAPPAGVRDVLVKFATPGDKGSFTETPS